MYGRDPDIPLRAVLAKGTASPKSTSRGTPSSPIRITDTDGMVRRTSPRIETPPQHGTAVFDPAMATVEYTPIPGYVGEDAFTYSIEDDGGARSAPAIVRLVIST